MHRCMTDPAADLQPRLALQPVAVNQVCVPPAGEMDYFQLEGRRLRIDSSMKDARQKMR